MFNEHYVPHCTKTFTHITSLISLKISWAITMINFLLSLINLKLMERRDCPTRLLKSSGYSNPINTGLQSLCY